MEKIQQFIAVIKPLKSGKFLIKFPDFEGISSIAEKEESIEKVAAGILNTKVQELREEKIEIPSPMKVAEIQKLLEEKEFILFIKPKNSFNTEEYKEGLKKVFNNIQEKSFKENIVKIPSKLEKLVETKIVNIVKEKNYNLIGVAGGILFTLSATLPIIKIDTVFFGTKKIGFFNLNSLKEYSGYFDIDNKIFVIKFIIILMMMSGLFAAYSAFFKKEFYLKAAISISSWLYKITFLYTLLQFLRIERELRKYIGFSYYTFFLLVVSIILMDVSFSLLEDKGFEREGKK